MNRPEYCHGDLVLIVSTLIPWFTDGGSPPSTVTPSVPRTTPTATSPASPATPLPVASPTPSVSPTPSSSVAIVSDITFAALTWGGQYRVIGLASMEDEAVQPISGLSVTATWTLPDGTRQTQQVVTGGSGIASFSLFGGSGLYGLSVRGTDSSVYEFDPSEGDPSESILV